MPHFKINTVRLLDVDDDHVMIIKVPKNLSEAYLNSHMNSTADDIIANNLCWKLSGVYFLDPLYSNSDFTYNNDWVSDTAIPALKEILDDLDSS